ncbi:MAG: hypothetical protein E7459_05735, partial [Ruminococcaceae bacterium]|nr:hypothetical protein [Oscillospiraceae bacterium]
MKKHLPQRLLSLLLVFAMLVGFVVPVQAAHDHDHTVIETAASEGNALGFNKLESNASLELLHQAEETEEESPYADTEMVRVSIVLDKESTIESGFSTENIAANPEAMSYRDGLKAEQEAMTASIEAAIGEELDVVWNLTLVANVISANVEYGQIDEIEALEGVKEVFLETRYEPCVLDQEEALDPNMATSGNQIGSNVAWASGYTGAGSRIAVIDTGIDSDHQSMSAAAFEYSLKQNAAAKGMDYDAYVESLDLLDAEEIAGVLDQLHIINGNAQSLHFNTKIAFGYNYVDEDSDIVHDNDTQGSHGSHVSGIATANKYIPNGDGTFAKALDAVYVQGVAPDAQLLTMKVFGKAGGAYDADYMVAIEDAIILGADAVNLSLGSASHGFVTNAAYQEMLNSLTEKGTVVTISGGNNGSWAEDTTSPTGLPYADDINYWTGGAPGSLVNSLGVASVQNSGTTGIFFSVAGNKIVYNETEYSNLPLTTIGGDHQYVFIDGFGSAEEWAAVGSALQGKVAICSRGNGVSFFQKANFAVEAGAIATIIYNNTDGVINMDLTDYTKTAPVVSITQEDGALIKSVSTPVTDDAGNVLYYTGDIKVDTKVGTSVGSDQYYTMSTFSSWGVPTALIMKPEITTPGGNIYSLDGVDKSGKAYENNSGTSMAAPQAAGMVALVAQYIRETGLDKETGRSIRQLAHSLLMSTAVPIREKASNGNYYSVLNQGSGLANVGAAVTANSYIFMNEDATASWADGKVKVELGDDPERNGNYTFSFSLNNFSDNANTYTLRADLFTQAITEADGIRYLSRQTTPLAANVSYKVNGASFVPGTGSSTGCDLDNDGDTDADDAQIVLDYVVGIYSDIPAIADVNKDGKINTWDAHLILSGNSVSSDLVVPAGGKADITVTITLPESAKTALDAAYVNGTYIEGYIFVEPTSSVEGVLADVVHSVPVLGFYGNWTDSSMFEKNTYVERLYGDTTPTYFNPSDPASGLTTTNSLVVKFDGDPNNYYLVGNPFFEEETYPADRVAVGNNTTLKNWKVTLIRNAAAVASYVMNEAGEVVYISNPTNNVYGAYYYTAGSVWRNTSTSVNIGTAVSKLGLNDGERITVGVVAVPEYYAKNGNLTAEAIQELIETDVLGEGAYLSTSMTVDNTFPVVTRVTENLDKKTITVTAKDENYLAAIRVTNLMGTKVYASVNPNQTEKGEEVSIEVDMEGIRTSRKFLVTVADYAGNITSYEVVSAREPEDFGGQMFAWSRASARVSDEEKAKFGYVRWMKIDPATVWANPDEKLYSGTTNFTFTTYKDQIYYSNLDGHYVTAADYVEGFVVFALQGGDLYSAPMDDLDTVTYMANWLDVVTEHGGEKIIAMHLNYADGYMYLLDDAQNFYRFDLVSRKLEYVFSVTLTNPATTSAGYLVLVDFAIHKDGTFYAMNKGPASSSKYLYKFTLDDVKEYENEDGTKFIGIRDLPPIVNEKGHDTGITASWNPNQMAFDHDNGTLYCVGNTSTNISANIKTILYKVDLETGKASAVNSYRPSGTTGGTSASLYTYVYGLFVVPAKTESNFLLPGDTATDVTVTAPRQDVLVNASMPFTTEVNPWNLEDKSVTWSTSDPAIATIDAKGVATFHKVGQVTVTATSVAKPNVTGSMEITVMNYPSTVLSAAVTDADGNTWMSEFNTDNINDIDRLMKAPANFVAGGYHDGKVYYHDAARMYAVDAESLEVEDLGILASSWQWSDAASLPQYGPDQDHLFDNLLGFSNGGVFIELITPETGTLLNFDLSGDERFTSDPFAAVCYAGPYTQRAYPGYSFYAIRESGIICQLHIFTEVEGKNFSASFTQAPFAYQTALDVAGASTMGNGSYISAHYDPATGYVLVTLTAAGGQTELYAVDPTNGITAKIGTFAEGIDLVNGLYIYDRATELTVRPDVSEIEMYTDETFKIDTVVLPAGNDQDVVWSTDNDKVAKVDNNGVVSAEGVGSATLEVNTVQTNDEGKTASAQVSVDVKPLTPASMKFNAQVTDENGNTYWAEIDTTNMTITKLGDAEVTLIGGSYHNGKIYGNAGDYVNGGYMYEIDPANGFAASQGALYSGSQACVDGATAPALLTDGLGSGYHNPLYTRLNNFLSLTSSGQLLMISNYQSSTASGFNLGSYVRGGAAIALTEEVPYTAGTSKYNGYEYFILENDGDLHRVVLYPKLDKSTGAWSNSMTFTLRVANTGRVLGEKTKTTMTYINDGVNKGLLIAYSGKENAELYFVELVSGEYVTTKIGTLDGITNVVSAYTTNTGVSEELDPYGKMFTWTRNTIYRLTELDKSIGMRDRWMTVDPDTLWFNTVKNEDSTYSYTGTENVAMTFYAENTGTVLAAEYWKDNVIFACSDGYLYSAPINDMANAKQLIYWQDTVSTINDMSLNYVDGYMYILANNGVFLKYNVKDNTMAIAFMVKSVCPNSTSVGYLYPYTFAIDDNGNFWAVNSGGTDKTGKYSYLYTWKLSDVPADGILSGLNPINPDKTAGFTGVVGKATCHMAWDHDKDVLYIMGNATGTSTGYNGQNATALLYTLDTTTGKATVCTDYMPEGEGVGTAGLMYAYTRSLFVVPADGGYNVPDPAPIASGEEENVEIKGRILGFTTINTYRASIADVAANIATRWLALDPDTLWFNKDDSTYTGSETYARTKYAKNVAAATYVPSTETVYIANIDGYIYSAPIADLNNTTQLANWSDVITTRINTSDQFVVDMAYNAKDGHIYLLGYDNTDVLNQIYKYDIANNTLVLDHVVTVINPAAPTKNESGYNSLRGMTIDEYGNFYAVSCSRLGSKYQFLYKWTTADVKDNVNEDNTVTRGVLGLLPVVNNAANSTGASATYQATNMVWDSDTDTLYLFGGGSAWTNTYHDSIYLFELDVNTGIATRCNTYYPEGLAETGTPALLYNYLRGAFYVPTGETQTPDPEPSEPEPSDPEPSDPEPSDPEPSDPDPSEPDPSEPATSGTMYAWLYNSSYRLTDEDKADKMYGRWMTVDPATLWFNTDAASYAYTGTTNVAATSYANSTSKYLFAAEYVNGKVIFAHADGYLYSAELSTLGTATKLSYWKDYTTSVRDMAVNYKDGYLYILGEGNTLFKYDYVADKMYYDCQLALTNPVTTTASYLKLVGLAIDDNGNFYGINVGSGKDPKYTYLYTWTADMVKEVKTPAGETVRSISGLAPVNNDKETGCTGIVGAGWGYLAYDHDADVLYALVNNSTAKYGQNATNILYTMDTSTGKATVCNTYVPTAYEGIETGISGLMYTTVMSLFVVPANGGNNLPAPDGNVIELVEPAKAEPAGKLMGWVESDYRTTLYEDINGVVKRWMVMDPETLWMDSSMSYVFSGSQTYTATNYAKDVLAAAYVNGTVYFASEDNYLYKAQLDDMNSVTQLTKWSDVIVNKAHSSDKAVVDMTYNVKDGNIYLLGCSNTDDVMRNEIYKYDIASDTITLDHTVNVINPAKAGGDYYNYGCFRGMTVDENGNFYAVSNSRMGSKYQFLYKWTLADVKDITAEDGTVSRGIVDLLPVVNSADNATGAASSTLASNMVWDSDNDKLYLFTGTGAWTSVYGTTVNLYEIDVNTGIASLCNNYYPEGFNETGKPGQVYTYVRGAFYVPANAGTDAITLAEQTFNTAETFYVPGTATTVSSPISISTDISELVETESAEAVGSTNTATVELTDGTEDEYGTDATLPASLIYNMKLDEPITNGKFIFTWDTDLLSFGNGFWFVNKDLTYATSIDQDNGIAVIAFAAAEPIPADTSLFQFSVNILDKNAPCIYTEVKVEMAEFNDKLNYATEIIALDRGAHNYVSIEDNDPTVITYQCSNCGHTYTEPVSGECDHDWGEWKETKAPTCNDKGLETRTCKNGCGETETREIPALGHDWGEWKETKAPTCNDKGEETRTCNRGCGATETREIPALGHDWGEWKETKAPTCDDKGEETRTCNRGCGATETREIPALGHDWGEWKETKAPTCDEKGEETRTCKNGCGATETREVEPLGHKYEKTTVAPTCTEVGYDQYKCSVCGDTYTDNEVPALGHSYTKTVVEATCDTEGYDLYTCSVCGYSYRDNVVAAKGHNYEKVVTEPTCTEMGYTTYTCSVCGDTYKDDYVNPTGHIYEKTVTEPTCTEIGYTTYTCACGHSYVSDYVAAKGHSFGDWEVVKPGTCTENGQEKRTCTVCGATETREIIGGGHN